MQIGLIGGTGPEGRGLAIRLALAGHEPIIGSRDENRADEVAHEIADSVGNAEAAERISGATNAEAARQGEIVFVSVPYTGLEDTLTEIARSLHNKVCVSVVSPIEVVGGTARLISVSAGSAAEEAQRVVSGARWVAGLHTLPARDLMRAATKLDTDCLLCGDDPDALSTVTELVDEIPGLRPVNCGRLENARYLEGMTALLINVNRIYKAHGSIRVAGIQASGSSASR